MTANIAVADAGCSLQRQCFRLSITGQRTINQTRSCGSVQRLDFIVSCPARSVRCGKRFSVDTRHGSFVRKLTIAEYIWRI